MDTLSVVTSDAVTSPDGRAQLIADPNQTYAVVVQHNGYQPFVSIIPGDQLPDFITLIPVESVPVECFNTSFTISNAEGTVRLEDAIVTLTGRCITGLQSIRSDATGFASICLAKNCPVKAEITREGYSPHTFTFTPEDENDNWTVFLKSGASLTSPPAPYSTGTVIVLDNIYYDFNKSAIRKSDAGELQALADILKKYPDLTIELTSHTDTRGSDEYNMELSARRSESSKDYLVLLGVNESRIITKAAGESTPRNRCIDGVPCSEAEHQYNRRTEVRITNPAQGMEVRYRSNG
jgi:outer membrane protein OmpA-like peptidoglycan-associated protein